MQSESARATTAAEARYRVEKPNSQPRCVKVVALGRKSDSIVQRLSTLPWARAQFLTASAFSAAIGDRGDFTIANWLSDLAGRAKSLVDEVAAADLMVMVAIAGENAHAAEMIGVACRARNVMATGLVLSASARDSDGAVDTLAQVRPHVGMLVAAPSEAYIEDMLTALRA
jgi:hypothetical protein